MTPPLALPARRHWKLVGTASTAVKVKSALRLLPVTSTCRQMGSLSPPRRRLAFHRDAEPPDNPSKGIDCRCCRDACLG